MVVPHDAPESSFWVLSQTLPSAVIARPLLSEQWLQCWCFGAWLNRFRVLWSQYLGWGAGKGPCYDIFGKPGAPWAHGWFNRIAAYLNIHVHAGSHATGLLAFFLPRTLALVVQTSMPNPFACHVQGSPKSHLGRKMMMVLFTQS